MNCSRRLCRKHWDEGALAEMPRFPVDAPFRKVIKAFERLGFRMVREETPIAMVRENIDGARTRMTISNHTTLKAPTLRTLLTQSKIHRDDFLSGYFS